MEYTATNSIKLEEDHLPPGWAKGDKIKFFITAFNITGTGADNDAKGLDLKTKADTALDGTKAATFVFTTTEDPTGP